MKHDAKSPWWPPLGWHETQDLMKFISGVSGADQKGC